MQIDEFRRRLNQIKESDQQQLFAQQTADQLRDSRLADMTDEQVYQMMGALRSSGANVAELLRVFNGNLLTQSADITAIELDALPVVDGAYVLDHEKIYIRTMGAKKPIEQALLERGYKECSEFESKGHPSLGQLPHRVFSISHLVGQYAKCNSCEQYTPNGQIAMEGRDHACSCCGQPSYSPEGQVQYSEVTLFNGKEYTDFPFPKRYQVFEITESLQRSPTLHKILLNQIGSHAEEDDYIRNKVDFSETDFRRLITYAGILTDIDPDELEWFINRAPFSGLEFYRYLTEFCDPACDFENFKAIHRDKPSLGQQYKDIALDALLMFDRVRGNRRIPPEANEQADDNASQDDAASAND